MLSCMVACVFGRIDQRINERELLFVGAAQISDVTEGGVGVGGGSALHQFVLSFRGFGLMHDDADTFPCLDRATPPECSMIWRVACPP